MNNEFLMEANGKSTQAMLNAHYKLQRNNQSPFASIVYYNYMIFCNSYNDY